MSTPSASVGTRITEEPTFSKYRGRYPPFDMYICYIIREFFNQDPNQFCFCNWSKDFTKNLSCRLHFTNFLIWDNADILALFSIFMNLPQSDVVIILDWIYVLSSPLNVLWLKLFETLNRGRYCCCNFKKFTYAFRVWLSLFTWFFKDFVTLKLKKFWYSF